MQQQEANKNLSYFKSLVRQPDSPTHLEEVVYHDCGLQYQQLKIRSKDVLAAFHYWQYFPLGCEHLGRILVYSTYH